MVEYNNVFDVCDLIIIFEMRNNRQVSNLRLQKLLYFIQAQFIVEFDKPCFNSLMEAWHYGPVIPSVFQAYKHFGSLSITQTNNKSLDEARQLVVHHQTVEELLDRMSKYSTTSLVNISHEQAPWKNSYSHGREEITIDSIKAYFLRGGSYGG